MKTVAINHNELIGKTVTVSYEISQPNIYTNRLERKSGEVVGVISDTTQTAEGTVYVAIKNFYANPRVTDMWHRMDKVVFNN